MPALQDSPTEVVRQLLIQRSQASDPDVSPLGDWPIYQTDEPDVPDNLLVVQATTGTNDGRDMVDGELNQHYGIQFKIRGTDDRVGGAKAYALRDWLARSVYQASVTITDSNGTRNYVVWCFAKIGQVLELGTDAPSSKRWLYTINAVFPLQLLS